LKRRHTKASVRKKKGLQTTRRGRIEIVAVREREPGRSTRGVKKP